MTCYKQYQLLPSYHKLRAVLWLPLYFCGFHVISNSHHPYQWCNMHGDIKSFSVAQGECTNFKHPFNNATSITELC